MVDDADCSAASRGGTIRFHSAGRVQFEAPLRHTLSLGVLSDGKPEETRAAVRAMMDASRHRSPDGRGSSRFHWRASVRKTARAVWWTCLLPRFRWVRASIDPRRRDVREWCNLKLGRAASRLSRPACRRVSWANQHRRTRLCVFPEQCRALANGTERLVKEMGQAGRTRVEQHFPRRRWLQLCCTFARRFSKRSASAVPSTLQHSVSRIGVRSLSFPG